MQHFGIGALAAIPAGTITGVTPVPFGLIKDISVDFDRKYVTERGQWAHAVAVGAGEIDVKGKCGTVSVFGGAIGQLFGVTPVAGSTLCIPNETGTIPAPSGPYTITCAQSATWAYDFGVWDLTTGLQMSRIVSGPATTQYSVAAGIYTFAAADTGHKVQLAYAYTSAAGGKTVAVVNTNMTIATGIVMYCYAPTVSSKVLGVKFYNTYFPKLGLSLKAQDFTAQNLEFFCAEAGDTLRSVCDVFTGE